MAELSDAEFDRIMLRLENHTIYESAKILREQWVLELDNGKTIYLGILQELDEGLEYLSRGDIDLVITDLRMPGTSGEEVLKKVRSEIEKWIQKNKGRKNEDKSLH